MKIVIDTDARTLVCEDSLRSSSFGLYTREAFELITEQWLKVGWAQRYSYTFTWFGRPIIQLPEDMIRMQEVIYMVQPDVIVETGVAHGGSLIFYASLCSALNKGRVIGVDLEIKAHNRNAIEKHELSSLITLVEGDSVAPQTVNYVKSLIKPGETVLVILDSNHTKQHVLAELEAYHNFVTPGSYIVATDGVMKDLYDVPGGKQEWSWDNPTAAAEDFAQNHPEFEHGTPSWQFNESSLEQNITYWPGAWLRKLEQ